MRPGIDKPHTAYCLVVVAIWTPYLEYMKTIG